MALLPPVQAQRKLNEEKLSALQLEVKQLKAERDALKEQLEKANHDIQEAEEKAASLEAALKNANASTMPKKFNATSKATTQAPSEVAASGKRTSAEKGAQKPVAAAAPHSPSESPKKNILPWPTSKKGKAHA